MFRYNPVYDRWERRRPTHKPRFCGSLHPIKGKLYLVGGISTESHEPYSGMRGEAEVTAAGSKQIQAESIGGDCSIIYS